MNTYIALLFLCLSFLLSFEAKTQEKIKGSGYVLTQQRELAGFNAIETSDEVTVIIVQGEFQPLVVEADDNLFPYIRTVVRDRLLKVYISDTVRITKYADMNVLISMPALLSLKATAKGRIDASPQHWDLDSMYIKTTTGGYIKLHCDAENIQVDARTSGRVELKGNTHCLEADLKTAARLEARELKTSEATIDMSTGAKAELQVHQEIRYNLSGNSRLQLWGKPFIQSSSLSSGSQLVRER